MNPSTPHPLKPLKPLKPLPPKVNFETMRIYKPLVAAKAALSELRGTAKSLPNPAILIDTLFLQEALASSEIENIVTTQDEAFQATLSENTEGSVEAKEVNRYSIALRHGYESWRKRQGISENMLIKMFQILKQRDDGYRALPGTVVRNQRSGEIIYTPPQEPNEIVRLMRDLETFINDMETAMDPLIRMALIHHQFESIHPFFDGNGRVGRMLNVLYLSHAGLLDEPILYLSRAINATRPDYYRLLQAVRDEGAWADWVIYMLTAVEKSAHSSLRLIEGVREEMLATKRRMRSALPKLYSQDLLNNLFRRPYTRIEYVAKDIDVHYNTASSHLKKLAAAGFVEEMEAGRSKYYVNRSLLKILLEVSEQDEALAAAARG